MSSPIRPIVSVSYGAGMSTRTWRNPSSRIGRSPSAISAGGPTKKFQSGSNSSPLAASRAW